MDQKQKQSRNLINISLGLFFLLIGLWAFLSGSFEDKIVIVLLGSGGLFILISLIRLINLKLGTKSEKTVLLVSAIIGIFLVVLSLFLMEKNNLISVILGAVGITLFAPNYIEFLRRRFPGIAFMDKKPYEEEIKGL